MLCSGVGFPDTFAAQFTFSGTAQHNYYTAGNGAEILPCTGCGSPMSAEKCCCGGVSLQATVDFSFSKTINVKPIIISQPLYIRVCVYFTDTLTTGDTAPVKRWVVYSEYWKRYYVAYSGYGSSTYSRTIPSIPYCHVAQGGIQTCSSNCTLEQIPCDPSNSDNLNFWISRAYESKDIPTARVKIYNTKPSGVISFTDEDLGTGYEVFGCKPIGTLYEDTQVEFDIPDAPCLCNGINPRPVYNNTITHRPRCLPAIPHNCGCALDETLHPDCPPFVGDPCDFLNDNPCLADVQFAGSGVDCWTFTASEPDAFDFCSPRCYGNASGSSPDWYVTKSWCGTHALEQFTSNPCTGTALPGPPYGGQLDGDRCHKTDITSDPFLVSQGNCAIWREFSIGCWGIGPPSRLNGSTVYPQISGPDGNGESRIWRLIYPDDCANGWVPEFERPCDAICYIEQCPDNGCPGRSCLCFGYYNQCPCFKHFYWDSTLVANVSTPQKVGVHLQQNTVSYSVTCSVGDKVIVQAPSPTWAINLDWSQVPDPTNWTTIEYDCTPNTSTITSKQITGVNIAGSIQLRIDPGTGTVPTLYYKITSTQQTGTVTGPPGGTWTAITAVTTITVNNNEWVSFCTYDSTGSTSSRTATVTANPGACESELDTFAYQSTCPADVTPCSVNWTTTTYSGVNDEANIVSQQITCINTTITLQIQPGSGTIPTLYYKITSTQQTGNVSGTPDGTWTAVTSNTNISVSNNQWLSFVSYTNPSNNGSRTATVVNVTDSNTTLDTFTYDSTI